MGAVPPQRITSRPLSVTDISECHHLGHTQPHLLAAPQGPFGTQSVVTQHGDSDSPEHPLAGPAQGLPPSCWSSTARLGSVCAQSPLSSSTESWGWHRGCPDPPAQYPKTRGEGRNQNCPFPAQRSCSTATCCSTWRSQGERGMSRATASSSAIPMLTVAPPRDGKLQGERQEGNPGGTHHPIHTKPPSKLSLAEGCKPTSLGLVSGQYPGEVAPEHLPLEAGPSTPAR